MPYNFFSENITTSTGNICEKNREERWAYTTQAELMQFERRFDATVIEVRLLGAGGW